MTVPTDTEIARAEALGRAAARDQLPMLESNPYPREARVLRARFLLAYVRAGGRAGLETGLQRVRARAREWWNREDPD